MIVNIAFEIWLSNETGTQSVTLGNSTAIGFGHQIIQAHLSRAMSGFHMARQICNAHDDAIRSLMDKYAIYLDSYFRSKSPTEIKQICLTNPICQYCAFLDCLDIRYEYGKAYHDHHPWSSNSWYQDSNKRVQNANPPNGIFP